METNDGDFVICGSTLPMYFPWWNIDGYIVKINSYGDTIWTRRVGDSLGGNPKDYIFDVIINRDNELVFTGTRFVPYVGVGAQVWFLKFTMNGNLLLDKKIGGNQEDNWWLLRLNDIGETLWTRWWGGPLNDDPYSLIPTPDGGILIAGWRDANSNDSLSLGDAQFWVIKADTLGFVYGITNSAKKANWLGRVFNISPNPFRYQTRISFEITRPDDVALKVFDILGREVATLIDKYLTEGKHTFLFNAHRLPVGLYFCELKIGRHFKQTRKLIFKGYTSKHS